MAQTALSHLLSLTPFLFLLFQINAQSTTAPAPTAAAPINIFDPLVEAGQYKTFVRLLNQTQVGDQINTQVKNSYQGMTVFAPTDNAFQNLPSGALNKLNAQQQVELVLYHVVPKCYSLSDLQTVSNPVRTQASGQDGQVYGLNFTGEPTQNQVNVSTGIVETPIYNALRTVFPLAVYEVDKVLWPMGFNQTKAAAPASSPPALSTPNNGTSSKGATAPAESSPVKSDARSVTAGLSLVSGLWLLCMGMLF